MNNQDETLTGRRNLLTNLGVAAVAGLTAATATSAQAVTPAAFEPARHDQDAWMNEIPGVHRVFVDSSSPEGGGDAMRFGSNVIQTHVEAYKGKQSDVAAIICFRHGATPYGYGDALWAKYGAILSRGATPTPTANPMNSDNELNGGNTIDEFVKLGGHFAICNRSTRRWSQTIAKETNQKPEDVYAEIQAGLVPNGRLVPAGVVAATRAQEYGYSYLFAL